MQSPAFQCRLYFQRVIQSADAIPNIKPKNKEKETKEDHKHQEELKKKKEKNEKSTCLNIFPP
jgi:hypothetical protein